ncbi:DUF1877 domain-containing protein [Tsukamurella strandjordii]|uniref:DUF1877 family protein n=1 Tax=Tsukamurella TaxID=2060 RepID=UPI001C7D8EDE|nr:DUF1877 family protein [Tsukamurella sp. TY48]GIZ98802.1 hypothetical protein TTY48_34140 [Tsukamurella sp. TY48]
MSVVAAYFRVAPTEVAALRATDFDLDAFDEARQAWDEQGRVIDIDQAHEALHAVLTAQRLPVPVVYAGAPVPNTEIGYGPVVLVPPDEVRTIAGVLATRPTDEVITAQTVRAAHGIGPVADWTTTDGIDYLVFAYAAIRDFYTDAAADDQTVLIVLE